MVATSSSVSRAIRRVSSKCFISLTVRTPVIGTSLVRCTRVAGSIGLPTTHCGSRTDPAFGELCLLSLGLRALKSWSCSYFSPDGVGCVRVVPCTQW